jgi:ribosomal protein S18 acetylase RimI-like enzyme
MEPQTSGENAKHEVASRLKVVLEPVHETNDAFLFAVYASTRSEEVAQTGWPPEMQKKFLRMQFDAQAQSYAAQFPESEYSIVRSGEVAVGRIRIDRAGDEILLIDVGLLTEHRARGIGTFLMAKLMEEGRRDSKAIRLHVERFNPAMLWYQRLGFKTVQESQIYLEMLWQPGESSAQQGGVD